ncbi:hypothetical protein MSG28_004418 [Choristoneura fumiferana]|uniref:Uncharacterized protein n=1 Tax=Choristoneura fumiferana TaxID=7141 RepID=A0ACC0K610_CHOFU|nr:hypothetical protein MSG28_004418 [Choristoneura fumiferana]
MVQCLVSVTSCEGWEVSTIEGVGSRHAGYHPLQKTLAKHNGTQCGYCSPEIEQSFGSNICRCTGYRPILEAFKTFASDAPEPHDLLDIEDLNICKKNGKICLTSTCSESDWCLVEADDIPQNKEIELKDGRSWFRVLSVKEIFEVLGKNGDDSYMFVAGNTAKGAYPISEYPRVLIDISSVNELKGYHLDQNLVIGAALTLTETMDIFEHLSVTEADFWYLEKLRQHLLKVAHIPVRNIGTIGGNLMTKHQHFNFQSDVFLLLETVVDSSGSRKIFTPEAFLKLNMKGKIIFNILLPPLGQDYKFVSFKIMPRAQNAHAIVNAGYLYKLCSLQTTVLEARIVYGGLSAHFVHAENTEKFLIRKKLFTNETLQAALKVLEQELVVTENLPEPSGLLSLCPGSLVGARYGSGGVTLSSTRPVSNARQIFTTNPTLYPINQPVPKAEALIQCAGEASYTEDLPRLPCEVYGAFVLATAPLGDIHSIDASDALQQPGVIDFYSAKDIPGVNSFIPRIDGYSFADEEVFCEGPVRYNGQVIGVIVAETRRIAENAAKRVLVKYSNIKKPVIDIKKAKKDANRTKMAGEKSGGSKGTEIYKIVKGDETIYQQTHFCMETLMCVTKPTEEGLEAYCATQWLDNTQAAISRVLKMPENNGVCAGDSQAESTLPHHPTARHSLALDPLEVRLRNLDPAYTELREMVERVKNDAQYADRRAAVDKYNAQNRWKKRGLRFSLLRWTPFGSQNIDVNLSVYHDDGTVAITHGAVEMGQGLNTKAIQIAAHVLNIPMEKIEIKGSNTINTPNGPSTGGSLTSNNVGLGVVRACEQLLSRMAPIRASMVDATWEEQVQAAYNANVDLQAHGFVSLADKQKSDVFGVTLAEVEVDVLTGEWELVRVDLLEDAGLSVEGAFIMGLGYWTCEQLVFDPETGEMLTDRTWNYHVPQARDIPQDFRVYFRNKSYSEPQYFGAKAIGEPPTCMSVAVPFAMREAIVAARLDAGLPANSGFRVVGREVSSDVTLLDYLRVGSELRGSKYMCREGGCGACVVAAARAGDALVAVNSCLVSVTSCEGWEVSTIEGVGSRHAGYHPLQKTLAKHNGTQCGYCSPGWVMTMYSLLQGKKKLTMLEIEQSLAGNICRCTGYRPILDAFKTFASDAPKPNSLQDIEDLNICKKNGKACHKVKSGSDWCIVEEQDIKAPQNLEIELKDGKSWFKVNIINDLFKVLQGKGDDSYMLVAGNTAKGVYPIDEYPRILIDISSVDELKGYKIDQNLILGAGSTLTETIDIFESVASSEDYFWYLENLREHLFLVAHPSVRNLGSIAGNLMTKHQHNDFQSDIFVLFETVGAFLTIQTIVTLFLVDHSGNRTTVTPEEFLKIDMRSKIILNILLPPLGRDYKFVSFKIMHRAQNSRAIVNVGFLYKLSDSNNVIEARIVYGGLSAKFVHAEKTETFLVGKKLFTNKNLQAAIKVMEQELVVEANPPEPSGLLSLCPKSIVTPRLASGGITLSKTRPVSKAHQQYTTYPALYPLNKPTEKVEALLFCNAQVKYNGQVVGIIAAETRHLAEIAAKLVHVKYKNVRKPVIDIKEAKKDPNRTKIAKEINGGSKGKDLFKIIKGQQTIYSQYHLCMETLVCVTKPTEEGMEVHSATQYMDGVQVMISRALKIPQHKIDVYTRRVGGSYGEKISRGIQVAVACALVTQKLDRPCRILLPLTTHMKAVGKRLPCCTDYEAAVDISGKVQYCIEKQYMDNGYVVDEPLFLATLDVYNNCYDKLRWSYRVYSVTTDTASNTWCRSPGSLEAIAAVEFIMERIAYELSLDPLEVRLRNLDLLYSSELREMVQRVKNEAQYADRRVSVDKYNQENRWKKRGLRFCLLRWQPFSPIYLDVTMSVYNDDGTVAITHGGIEMGQGINTKAVQIAAFYLGIPAEKIQIKGNNTVIAPNGLISGGSITSTNIGVGIRRCCEQLLLRLAPFKAALLNASWETIVKAAYTAGIDLQTHGFVSYLDLQKADVFGVTLAEVEVDVLTGEWEVLRVDILEDAGLSTSPDIDVGQVSKAF